jgi:hypothetical protein
MPTLVFGLLTARVSNHQCLRVRVHPRPNRFDAQHVDQVSFLGRSDRGIGITETAHLDGRIAQLLLVVSLAGFVGVPTVGGDLWSVRDQPKTPMVP